jgi:hypothetical protein
MPQLQGHQYGALAVGVFFQSRQQRRSLSGVILRAIFRRFFLSPITVGRRLIHQKICNPNGAPRVNPWSSAKADKKELVILAVVGVWVLLQIYILPKFGIST